jgi:cell wall-associated NlpC family hydrolase
LDPNAPISPRRRRPRLAAAAVLTALAGLSLAAPSALADNGGTGISGGGGGPTASPAPVPGAKAKIVNGFAVPPQSAPQEVVDVINAANHIAKGHPYCLGGGHASFKSTCYDCSGSVSYALHGGGLLNYPQASSGFYGWGHRGKGSWITVYANGGHAFMTVAGLRFDTADTPGQGPGWAKGMGYENPPSFQARFKPGF